MPVQRAEHLEGSDLVPTTARRPLTERRGFWYGLAVLLLRRPLAILADRDWHGGENIPATGGVILCPNHVSYLDPLTFAHFVHDNGRLPRFLAKESLWGVPGLSHVLDGTDQIPVYRESHNAVSAFSAAVDAVRAGKAVAIYPEATITRDPDLWPMAGKTGAARVALATGAPVIPIAQWGPQDLLAPYAKRLRVFPRRTVHVHAGPPVDLSDLDGTELNAEVLREATDRILDAIAALLEQIRGEQAPATRFDPRTSALPRTGNPRRTAGSRRIGHLRRSTGDRKAG